MNIIEVGSNKVNVKLGDVIKYTCDNKPCYRLIMIAGSKYNMLELDECTNAYINGFDCIGTMMEDMIRVWKDIEVIPSENIELKLIL